MQLSPRYDGPPVLVIEDSPDPCAAVARQRRRLLATLGSLTDAQWAAPSRCAGWSVKDVICHLVTVDQFWTFSFAAGLRGEPTRFLATFDPVASPAQLVDGMQALLPADVLAQYTANAEGFLDVLASVQADQWSLPAEAPPGHLAMNVTALHALWDAWVHERDIDIPLGITPVEDDEEITLTLSYAAALSPALYATRATGAQGTLAVDASDPVIALTVEVGESAVVTRGARADGPRLTGRAVDLIEGLSHRAPLAHDLGADNQWLLLGLAEVFDQT
ncbi:MAG: hypothetical protein QOI61_1928 [Actinomycetota bacterium]